ncbi:hypothetical protein [Chitinophaga ginsengisoli]|uniref:Uncharacterized protein n=1 Tax=Chitinophaga ginsengisoli TaxID=363837 RepID=A0A2P8GHS5_9BACT|nr:hypothetical protein [Chitinophaga ginsengisoli]PSL33524.1 hypothetical protein CLV42_103507 [Chitinophaga ginsengisoli]
MKKIVDFNGLPAFNILNRPVKVVEIHPDLHSPMSFRSDPLSIGRPIPYAKAEQCMLAHSAIMKLHGFEENEGDTINVVLTRSRQITSAEQFLGVPFIRWLEYIHSVLESQYAPGLVQIVTKLVFAFYTDTFLNDPELNFSEAEKENKKGRISVFLVPVVLDTSKNILGAGSEVYDFGSLQP